MKVVLETLDVKFQAKAVPPEQILWIGLGFVTVGAGFIVTVKVFRFPLHEFAIGVTEYVIIDAVELLLLKMVAGIVFAFPLPGFGLTDPFIFGIQL